MLRQLWDDGVALTEQLGLQSTQGKDGIVRDIKGDWTSALREYPRFQIFDDPAIPKVMKWVYYSEIQAHHYLLQNPTTRPLVPRLFGWAEVPWHKPRYLMVIERLTLQPFPIKLPAKLVLQILSGVTAMAATGAPHRDLHWGNVVLTTSGDVKFIDFGDTRLGIASFKVWSERTWVQAFDRLDKDDPDGALLLAPRLQQLTRDTMPWPHKQKFRAMHLLLGASWYVYLRKHRPDIKPIFTKQWMDDFWYGRSVQFTLALSDKGEVNWKSNRNDDDADDERTTLPFTADPVAAPFLPRTDDIKVWSDDWYAELAVGRHINWKKVRLLLEQSEHYFTPPDKGPGIALQRVLEQNAPKWTPSKLPRADLQHQGSWNRASRNLLTVRNITATNPNNHQNRKPNNKASGTNPNNHQNRKPNNKASGTNPNNHQNRKPKNKTSGTNPSNHQNRKVNNKASGTNPNNHQNRKPNNKASGTNPNNHQNRKPTNSPRPAGGHTTRTGTRPNTSASRTGGSTPRANGNGGRSRTYSNRAKRYGKYAALAAGAVGAGTVGAWWLQKAKSRTHRRRRRD